MEQGQSSNFALIFCAFAVQNLSPAPTPRNRKETGAFRSRAGCKKPWENNGAL
jgi:hypothetical protein